jgi:hypothetical protein
MVRLQARLSAHVETLKTSHAIGRARGHISRPRVGGWARADGHPARLCGGARPLGALGDRIDRRRLILLQMTALALSLVAAALAPDAWALVVISALVGITSSVAQ